MTAKTKWQITAVALNFLNSSLSGTLSLLGIVVTISNVGMVPFVVLTTLAAMQMHCANLWMCRSAEMSQKYKTHALAEHYLGTAGSIFTKIMIVFGNWMFIVNIIQVFADLWFLLMAGSFPFIQSREFASIVGFCIILPFVAVRNISRLEGLSVVCLVFALFVMLVLVCNCVKGLAEDGTIPSAHIGPLSWYAMFYGLASIAWSWCVQYNTLPIYMTLHREVRQDSMPFVSLFTISGTWGYFILQALAVYLVWGTQLDSDFVENLVQNDITIYFYFATGLATITAFIICIGCFAAIPSLAYAARINFHSLYLSAHNFCCIRQQHVDEEDDAIEYQPIPQPEFEVADVMADDVRSVGSINSSAAGTDMSVDHLETSLSRWIEGSFLLLTATVVALCVDDLSTIVNLAGATYCSYMAYMFPAAVYLLAIKEHSADVSYVASTGDAVSKFLACVSIAFGVLVFFAGIVTISMP